MNFGSKIRNKVFWHIDKIKGNKIKNHYENIKLIMEEEIETSNQLEKIMHHAKDTTIFYKDINITGNLNILPVINKKIIIDYYDEFMSNKHKNDKLHSMSTSGSTGIPFTIFQDMNKRYRVLADLIYFNEFGEQYVGDKYMFVRSVYKKSSNLNLFSKNEILYDLKNITDEDLYKISNILLNRKKINSMIAYATTYEQLLNYVIDNGLTKKNQFKTLFSSSSLFEREKKIELSKLLNCNVLDRYANQENGLIAQTISTESNFLVNKASYRVELLKLNSDDYAEPGELGRIIITDLYNFAMPLLRYDTGDLGVTMDEDTSDLTHLVRVEGRSVDIIYDVQDRAISPHYFSVQMRKYSEIKQWKFTQHSKNFYILQSVNKITKKREHEIENNFLEVLGSEANFKIEYISEIQTLQSGKYKFVESFYKPQKGN